LVETLIRLVVLLITIGSFLFLVRALSRSIEQERRKNEPLRKGFGLSLTLLWLFLLVWFGHGLAQWQEYRSQQEEHGRPAEIAGFVDNFAQATLENWQSEYLQVFAFVVLAGLYIHRGSAESKDGEEEIKAMLRRIERKLDEKEKAAK
jgi:cell division protein FtsB